MYFGDWLRNTEIKNVFYVSFTSQDQEFSGRIFGALKKNGQISPLSSNCLMIESLESKKAVEKKIKKLLVPGEEAVFIYPHHKVLGHDLLHQQEDTGIDSED